MKQASCSVLFAFHTHHFYLSIERPSGSYFVVSSSKSILQLQRFSLHCRWSCFRTWLLVSLLYQRGVGGLNEITFHWFTIGHHDRYVEQNWHYTWTQIQAMLVPFCNQQKHLTLFFSKSVDPHTKCWVHFILKVWPLLCCLQRPTRSRSSQFKTLTYLHKYFHLSATVHKMVEER